MRNLTLLVLADLHLLQAGQAAPPVTDRQCDLGVELAERAITDARRGGGFDAVVLLGDLLEAGEAPGADRDLAALEEVIHEAVGDVPRIVVPGNHDGDAELVLSIFNDEPGLHEVKGWRLFSFLDCWDEQNVCRRPPDQMRRFAREARRAGEGPLIVLQHNPLHPPIESDYPYIPPDREPIMSAYAGAGVLLTLSGHYHRGQPLSEAGGVRYYTCPSLCGSPFRYALVRLEGQEVAVKECQLRLPEEPPLFDVHAHTHYAYCAENVTAEGVIWRARLFGLSGVCLSEHSDQLYLTHQEHRSYHALEADGYWQSPRSVESERMPRYRREMEPLRSDFVRLGLEIELDGLGRPGVRPSHLEGWDLLLGAVHWMPGGVEGRSLEEVKRAFMENVRTLLESGVDVLAHPFRFFRRQGLERPVDLYRPVVRMLARHGAMAEINFHTNDPDPEFFAVCLEEGVRVALASDAHELREVGDFRPHLALLRAAAGRKDVSDLIYAPPAL